MIKIAVIDLDNTLLRSDKTISEYTVSVLRQCQSNGIKIVYATARSAQAAARFVDFYTPDVFIGYGGALTKTPADNKIISRIDIPADVVSGIINDCLASPDIMTILAINEYVALTNRPKVLDDKNSSHYKYSDFTNIGNCNFLKITVQAASLTPVKKIAAQYPLCDLTWYYGEDLYKLANRDATKWNAIKTVAAHYNIGVDSIAAFGDDTIDLEMIEKCGVGVAVENAIDEVKAAADYICASNDDDGVARWLNDTVIKS